MAHASLAVLLQPILTRTDRSRELIGVTAFAAALPDVDAIGRPFGQGDIEWLGGHRALTHSLSAAVVVACVSTFLMHRRRSLESAARVFVFVALAVAAHGVLDAFTTYGSGVEFLAPFSSYRFRSDWRPLDGLWPEVFVFWLPAFVVLAVSSAKRRGSDRLPTTRDWR